MAKLFCTSDDRLRAACAEFWHTYFQSMKGLHTRLGRGLDAPIKDRNLGTTDSRHVSTFEQFWRQELATALGVSLSEVGPRRIRFRPHRTKSFDVCWPMEGEPKILISIKSMQNAYRNFTNRIEEAFGDSAVLRLYRVPAVFGFFFFMLDGNVPRGLAQQRRITKDRAKQERARGIAPYLELLEEGGDFFQLPNIKRLRKKTVQGIRGRQDTIGLAEQSLLDLVAVEPTAEGGIHYDAIAFVPTRVKRLKKNPKKTSDWAFTYSLVEQRLDFRAFIRRLIDVARFRRLI